MHCIQKLRKQSGMSQQELADRLGVSRSTIGAWESAKIKAEPDHAMLVRLADLYDVTVDELLGRRLDNGTSTLPLIGEVCAGFNGEEAHESYTGDHLEVPSSWLQGAPPSEFFVLRASGSSMWPEIKDGDLLLVRRTSAVDNGRTAIVIFGDGAGTVKTLRYSPGGGYLELVPRNPEYETLRISGEDLARVHIQGEVKMIVREVS